MDECRFSRLFPPELEHRILALLGLLDLKRTALVCGRFRDMSVSLLFRHIAYRSVHFDENGHPVYKPLCASYKALYRVLDDVTLGRHVRYLDINVPLLCSTAVPGQAAPLTPDELQTVWSSMPGLVALSVNGRPLNGQNLGLQNVDFPRLQRLGLDLSDLDIDFLQRHLPKLQHLRLPPETKASLNCDPSGAALIYYEGPYHLLVQLLRDDAHKHSLESCVLSYNERSGVPPTLAPLARHLNLRHFSILLDGRATILEMIRGCPPLTGVKSLILDVQDKAERTADPPWSQLMRPFPAALHIVADLDMVHSVIKERGLAWAQEISETCKDVVVVVMSRYGFRRAGPGFNWEADAKAYLDYDYTSLEPPVVYPVPR